MGIDQYVYLIGVGVFGIVWLILFLVRPDLRRPMIVMGFLIGILSFLSAWLWWTKDWWHPLTITGTRVGIEDFLLGFVTGGVATVLYEELFRQRLFRRGAARHTRGFVMLWTICLGTIALGCWALHWTSFMSFALAALIVICSLIGLRRDLFHQALVSGLLMTVVVLPFYYAMIALQPNWVSHTYDLNHLSRVMIGGIPFEEFIFYFVMGFTLGPGYEYWQNERLEVHRTTRTH